MHTWPSSFEEHALTALRWFAVQDAIFAEPRLARIYDVWEGERIDLPSYLAIVTELGARSVFDVGCGTGNWASMLAERGCEVVGLDPAAASLDVARPSQARSGCDGSRAT